MAVDGGTRHKLQTSAKRALGDEEGDALMVLLPPIGWDDFATKHDVKLAKQEILTALHQEINASVTSQTKAFLWANAGMLIGMAGIFGTVAVILR